jgi:hypothetical protein
MTSNYVVVYYFPETRNIINPLFKYNYIVNIDKRRAFENIDPDYTTITNGKLWYKFIINKEFISTMSRDKIVEYINSIINTNYYNYCPSYIIINRYMETYKWINLSFKDIYNNININQFKVFYI